MLKQRLALWALGLALPEMSDLRPLLYRGMRGMALLVVAALLAALLVICLLAMFYLYLSREWLSPLMAAGVVTAFVVMVAGIAWWQAWRQLSQMSDLPQRLQPFGHHAPDALGQATQLLVSGFIEGLLHPSNVAHPRIYGGEPPK